MLKIQDKIDNALVAAKVRMMKFTEREEGQNSIEYAGMIAVAGIIIGIIIAAAQAGWGEQLKGAIDKAIQKVVNAG